MRRSPRLALISALVILLSGGTGVYAGLGGFTNPQPEINLSQGLIAHWNLNGNANDASGYNKHLTVNGGATLSTDRNSIANSAYEFDDVDDYLMSPVVANSPSTETLSLWIYPTSTGVVVSELGQATPNTGYHYIKLGINNTNELRGNIWNCNQSLSYGTINLNQWYHVAISFTGSAEKAYLNGEFKSTVNCSRSSSANQYLAFGASDSQTGGGFNDTSYYGGKMDDIRLYNRALSDAEIASLFSNYGEGSSRIAVADTQKGLVGHWKLDGDAKDSSAYRNHGTVTGATPTTDRHGKPNGAYSFDGTDDYLSITHNAVLGQAGSFTLAAWVYPLDRGNYYMVMTKQPSPGYGTNLPGNYEMRLAPSSGVIQFLFEAPAGGVNQFNGVTAVPQNQWSHIAVAFTSGNKVEIFLNGDIDTTIGTTKSSAVINTNPLLIGKRQDGYQFKGKIDDPRIYNRALSLSEIKQLYDQYDANVSVSSLQKQLVGHWSFDGDAKDRTPYRNHGTPTNGPVLATDRRGRANSAYSFDGVNDYVNLGDVASLEGMAALSVSTWVYIPSDWSAANDWNIIIDKCCSHAYVIQATGIGASTMAFSVVNSGGTAAAATFEDFNNYKGQWVHLVGTYDGSNVRTYFNGTLKNTTPLTGTVASNSNSLALGGRANNDPPMRYYGLIDDIRIYSRALNSAEVQALYESY